MTSDGSSDPDVDDSIDVDVTDIRDLAYLSRRGLLRTGASALPVALAGCGGGDDGDGGDTTTTTTTESGDGGGDGGDDGDGGDGGDGDNLGEGERRPVEERIGSRWVMPWHPGMPPIQNVNYNVYNPSNYITCCAAPGTLNYADFQLYFSYVDEEHMILGDSWSMPDDTTLQMTLRDDAHWWDGTQITTKDIEVKERMDKAIRDIQTPPEEQPEPAFVEGWNIVDDLTWELDLVEPFSEDYVQYALVEGNIQVKADLYESYVNEFEELLEDDDREGAEQALSDFLKTRFGYDKAYGNGPFKYREHDDTRYIMEVHDKYPYRDQLRFEEYVFRDLGQGPQIKEAFITEKADCIFNWTPTEDELQRAESNFQPIEEVRGDNVAWAGTQFSWGIFDLPEVQAPTGVYNPIGKEPEGWAARKAMAYAIDNEEFARAAQGEAQPIDFPTSGIPITTVRADGSPLVSWAEENLENYTGRDPEKARELFRAAGLTFDDGQGEWLYPDWHEKAGEPVELIYLSGTPPQQAQVIKKNFEDLGFSFTIGASENFGNERFQGEFDMVHEGAAGWGGFFGLPPGDFMAGHYNGPAWMHTGREWSVPMPIGNTDVTDYREREPVKTQEMWSEFLRTGDEELLKKAMWLRNQGMNWVELSSQVNSAAINGERWWVEGPRGLRHGGQNYYHLLKAEKGMIAPNAASDYHPNLE